MSVRQLKDLSRLTQSFTNLDNLIPEDIQYLNRIHSLGPYRAQIKEFLDIHKPYFIHEEQVYFLEDIASYHIHAADYFVKKAPRGGHSNYQGNKINYFNPTINKQSSLGAKEVRFYNSRHVNEIKDSSIYPETWSEYVCDLKAIEVMRSEYVEISERTKGTLTFKGKSTEGLDIVVHYDIANKRIKSHYPNSEKF